MSGTRRLQLEAVDLAGGTTRAGHVRQLLAEAAVTIAAARESVDQRLGPRQRDELSRRLAGVVGACESVRLWLGAGAPQ